MVLLGGGRELSQEGRHLEEKRSKRSNWSHNGGEGSAFEDHTKAEGLGALRAANPQPKNILEDSGRKRYTIKMNSLHKKPIL